jgi:DNA-binding CsgD family transcriptional regulator
MPRPSSPPSSSRRSRSEARGVAGQNGKANRRRRIQRRGAWSQDEIQLLKRIYGHHTDAELTAQLGRSPEAIRRMARRYALAKDKAFLCQLEGGPSTRMPRWTDEELDMLVSLYPRVANLEIARELGRSVKSVVSKAHQMGLRKSDGRLRQMGRENVALRHDR